MNTLFHPATGRAIEVDDRHLDRWQASGWLTEDEYTAKQEADAKAADGEKANGDTKQEADAKAAPKTRGGSK